jgi:hypothetical protein
MIFEPIDPETMPAPGSWEEMAYQVSTHEDFWRMPDKHKDFIRTLRCDYHFKEPSEKQLAYLRGLHRQLYRGRAAA